MSLKWTTNKNYVTVGEWSWDTVKLHSKIQLGTTPDDCDIWQGSMSPTGALFGARKQGYQQMCQTRRLIWMEENQTDVSDYRVTMQCQNQQCVNSRHFILKPTNKPNKL